MPIRPLLVLCILLCLSSSSVAQTRVTTDDITHFWEAYDRIKATNDTAEQRQLLHSHFIAKASVGQLAMFEARRYTPDEYLHAIRSYPRFWASVREHMLSADIHVQAMQDGVERLRVLYPQMRPADIYFTVGVLRSGGTITDGMVLIGSEIALADSSTVTDEFPVELGHLPGHFATNPRQDIAFANVHELIHTQQPGRWGYDLLSQSLHEGIAEFIPTLAMDRPSYAASVRYGVGEHREGPSGIRGGTLRVLDRSLDLERYPRSVPGARHGLFRGLFHGPAVLRKREGQASGHRRADRVEL